MTTFPLSNVQAFPADESDSESIIDSPGGDVMRKYPTLPESVYRRAVNDAIVRETALRRSPRRMLFDERGI